MSLLYLGVGPNSIWKLKLHVLKQEYLVKLWFNSRVKLNHRLNHYPLDSTIDFSNTYLMDSDSSDGKRYPSFDRGKAFKQK